jgi:aminoglycoside phosphotransferase (APT) family kinase protein
MSYLEHLGLAGARVSVKPLRGGRTSGVYRLEIPGRAGSLVLKVSRPDRETPVFDNRPQDEWAILCALSSKGIAPMPVSKSTYADGMHLLVYQFEAGSNGASDATALAQLLRTVHAAPTPEYLPARNGSAGHLMAEADKMCADIPLPDWIAALRPTLPHAAPGPGCLVHRDPIASNIISDHTGTPLLIDWQCPAVGDPLEDIAHATSPAMSYVYGGDDPFCTHEVLEAYGNSALIRHASAFLSLYRWRMICYCHWKAMQGAQIYADAMAREADALERMRGKNPQKG